MIAQSLESAQQTQQSAEHEIRVKDLEITNFNCRIMDSRQILEEILKEIQEKDSGLSAMKASREEALIRLSESNETA